MKKFKYVGPFDAVDIAGVGVGIERGQTVEVEDPEVSAGLEGRDDWEHIPDKQRSLAAKKAAASRAADSDDSQEG